MLSPQEGDFLSSDCWALSCWQKVIQDYGVQDISSYISASCSAVRTLGLLGKVERRRKKKKETDVEAADSNKLCTVLSWQVEGQSTQKRCESFQPGTLSILQD